MACTRKPTNVAVAVMRMAKTATITPIFVAIRMLLNEVCAPLPTLTHPEAVRSSGQRTGKGCAIRCAPTTCRPAVGPFRPVGMPTPELPSRCELSSPPPSHLRQAAAAALRYLPERTNWSEVRPRHGRYSQCRPAHRRRVLPAKSLKNRCRRCVRSVGDRPRPSWPSPPGTLLARSGERLRFVRLHRRFATLWLAASASSETVETSCIAPVAACVAVVTV